MKFLAGYMVVLMGMMLVFVSCNNAADIASMKKGITGKWKISNITTEENNKETKAISDENNLVITFNADGSGVSSSVHGGSAFKWELTGNNAYLHITDSASGQSISLQLTKTASSAFTVKDTSTHPAQWETFKKL